MPFISQSADTQAGAQYSSSMSSFSVAPKVRLGVFLRRSPDFGFVRLSPCLIQVDQP